MTNTIISIGGEYTFNSSEVEAISGVIPKENLALKVIIYFKSGAEFVFNSPSPFDFPNDAPIEEINDIIKKGMEETRQNLINTIWPISGNKFRSISFPMGVK